jgi:uncharacterized protein (UPF0264 family)
VLAKKLLTDSPERPGLLVSVRSAEEACAALAGGADVIDVKEPDQGPLGAADANTIAEIVRTVNGRALVTAAAGEMVDRLKAIDNQSSEPMPQGVSFAKLGLARAALRPRWQFEWERAAHSLRIDGDHAHACPVAVVYADWAAAESPRPEQIHSAAVDIGCRVLLIDTWDKSHGSLMSIWPFDQLCSYVARVRASGLSVVLAGSLDGPNLLAASELRPQLVAVRGAACVDGRGGAVSKDRVALLRRQLLASGLGRHVLRSTSG